MWLNWLSRRTQNWTKLHSWQFVHHPDHLERVVEKFSRCIAAGSIYDDTFPMRGADHSYRWFLMRVTPARDQESRVHSLFRH